MFGLSINHPKDDFEQRCAPYAGMVYRHCLHMLKNVHEAEDAAQESMLRAFRAIFEGEIANTSERATKLTKADLIAAAFLAAFIVLFGIAPQLIMNL